MTELVNLIRKQIADGLIIYLSHVKLDFIHLIDKKR